MGTKKMLIKENTNVSNGKEKRFKWKKKKREVRMWK